MIYTYDRTWDCYRLGRMKAPDPVEPCVSHVSVEYDTEIRKNLIVLYMVDAYGNIVMTIG